MKRVFLIFLSLLALFFIAPQNIYANHSWGNYHWARTTNPFTLKLGDNLTPVWDPYLVTTSSDWSKSSVLDTTIVPGSASPRSCRPKKGQVEVCNYKYGNNGWLGIAQIWISGDHIYQGITKLNDTYFNTPTYNTPAWRNLVTCQEVGHNFGLDHQDENPYNAALGTCMDYTADPTPNQHPNAHDYQQLETMYAHLDLTTTIGQTSSSWFGFQQASLKESFDTPSEWGKEVSRNARTAIFERDLGAGHKLFTFAILTEEFDIIQ